MNIFTGNLTGPIFFLSDSPGLVSTRTFSDRLRAVLLVLTSVVPFSQLSNPLEE